LPVSGGDVTARGVAPGPQVGEILRAFECWWIGQGFPQDAETIAQGLELAITTTGVPDA